MDVSDVPLPTRKGTENAAQQPIAIARFSHFFLYTDLSHIDGEQNLLVVDFSGVPPRRNMFSNHSHEAPYSTFAVDSYSPYAMHPTQPWIVYCEKGLLKARRAAQTFELEAKRDEVSPLPMIWIDDNVLEVVGVQGQVYHYDFSQVYPRRITLPHLTVPFIVNAPSPLIVLSMTPDKQHALTQPTSSTSGSTQASIYTYDVPERRLEHLARFPQSTLYAALVWDDFASFLVEMMEVAGEPARYQVRASTFGGPLGSIPLFSAITPRPILANNEPQHLISVETFSPCGLILAAFELETHMFALVRNDGLIHRISPPAPEKSLPERDIAEAILEDCSTVTVSGAKVLKEQLLWSLVGASADVFSNFLQNVLESLDSAPKLRNRVLGLLQDVCSTSLRLPSSYWMSGSMAIGRYIRQGGEAILSRATHTFNGASFKVVVRQMASPDDDDWESLQGREMLAVICREVVTHRQLVHPNIVKLLGVWKDSAYPMYMVLPFLSGNVVERLRATPLSFWDVTIGVVNGIVYLHSREPPVIHGDLHPGNILIDEGGNAVLCDFGLSRMRYTIERSKTMIRFGANRRYMAPELPDPSSSDPFRSDEMSDVYSLALTLYHLRVLEPPFADLNDRDAAAYARLGNRPSRTRSLAQSSDGRLWGLFEDMWHQNQELRPSASDILERIMSIQETPNIDYGLQFVFRTVSDSCIII